MPVGFALLGLVGALSSRCRSPSSTATGSRSPPDSSSPSLRSLHSRRARALLGPAGLRPRHRGDRGSSPPPARSPSPRGAPTTPTSSGSPRHSPRPRIALALEWLARRVPAAGATVVGAWTAAAVTAATLIPSLLTALQQLARRDSAMRLRARHGAHPAARRPSRRDHRDRRGHGSCGPRVGAHRAAGSAGGADRGIHRRLQRSSGSPCCPRRGA